MKGRKKGRKEDASMVDFYERLVASEAAWEKFEPLLGDLGPVAMLKARREFARGQDSVIQRLYAERPEVRDALRALYPDMLPEAQRMDQH